jgi:glycosyltransferase involved in cell wall biosynthesis
MEAATATCDLDSPPRLALEKMAIFIPAYNAAATLPRVIERIPSNIKNVVEEILVIDNHSPDNTYLVAVGCKYEQNVFNLRVIRNPQNMGYGGSQKIAYQHAIDKGYKGVAMLHGDAQYAPELLGDLLAPILEGKADMVFGSRMRGDPRGGGMPLHRYLGNRFLTWIQNRFLGTRLSEFHSGYRVYSTEALRQVPFGRLSSDYHFDTEIIILLKEYGLKIREVPIPTHYGDEKNYVNVWKYGIDVLVTTMSYFFHKRGWRRSARWAQILGE